MLSQDGSLVRCIQHLYYYHQWHEIGIEPFPGPVSGWDLNPGWHVWLNFGKLWCQAPIFSCAPIPDPQELWNDKCALFEATTFVFICVTAITNTWKSSKQCHFGRMRIDWQVERGKHGSQDGPFQAGKMGDQWLYLKVHKREFQTNLERFREGLRALWSSYKAGRENGVGYRGITRQWRKHTSINI